LGNQQFIADSVRHLGYTNRFLGEYGVAEQQHEESLALYKEINDSWGMVHARNGLAMDHCGLGKYGEAKRLFQANLRFCREGGHPRGMAQALVGLAEIANALGEHGEAIQLAQESLGLCEKFNPQYLIGWNLKTLGDAESGLGDFHLAKKYYYRALETALSIPDAFLAPLALVGMASLLAAEGKKERTLELLTLVLHHPASWQSTRDQANALIAELAAELPPEAVAAAQERGRARNLKATVTELLVA
jgi:tetratricopeptide (TPR) repeat protein